MQNGCRSFLVGWTRRTNVYTTYIICCFHNAVCHGFGAYIASGMHSRRLLYFAICFSKLCQVLSVPLCELGTVMHLVSSPPTLIIILPFRNFEGRSFRYWFKYEGATPCNDDTATIETGVTYEGCLERCYSGKCELVIFETESKTAQSGRCKMCPVFQTGTMKTALKRVHKGHR